MRTFTPRTDEDHAPRFWRANGHDFELLEAVRRAITECVLDGVPPGELVRRICARFHGVELHEVEFAGAAGEHRLRRDQARRCREIIVLLEQAIAAEIPDDVLGATCADAVRLGELVIAARRDAFVQGFASGVRSVGTMTH